MYGVHCDIFTNHQSLRYLFSQKDLKLRWIKWLEYLKDYNVPIQYHLEKTNTVTNALSHGLYLILNHMLSIPTQLFDEFKKLEINVVVAKGKSILFVMEVQSILIRRFEMPKKSIHNL